MRTFHGRIARVRTLAYSPDGGILASAGDRGVIRLWDTLDGRVIRKIRHGHRRVNSLAYSPDGSMIASSAAGYPGKVPLWSATDGKNLAMLEERQIAVYSLAFRQDGRGLVVSGFGGVALWDVVTKKSVARYSTQAAWSSTFSPDGRLVAVGSGGIGIEFWDPSWPPNDSPPLDSSYPWAVAPLDAGRSSSGNRWKLAQRPEPRCVRFSPDGRLLAASAGWSSYIYDLYSLKRVASLKGHRQPVKSLDFSPDGRTLASASHDGTVRFWDPESGDERACFDWNIGAVDCAVFAPDGMTIAVGGEDGIVVWDVE